MGIESYEQLALRRSDSAIAQGALIPLDTLQIHLLGSE